MALFFLPLVPILLPWRGSPPPQYLFPLHDIRGRTSLRRQDNYKEARVKTKLKKSLASPQSYYLLFYCFVLHIVVFLHVVVCLGVISFCSWLCFSIAVLCLFVFLFVMCVRVFKQRTNNKQQQQQTQNITTKKTLKKNKKWNKQITNNKHQ